MPFFVQDSIIDSWYDTHNGVDLLYEFTSTKICRVYAIKNEYKILWKQMVDINGGDWIEFITFSDLKDYLETL